MLTALKPSPVWLLKEYYPYIKLAGTTALHGVISKQVKPSAAAAALNVAASKLFDHCHCCICTQSTGAAVVVLECVVKCF